MKIIHFFHSLKFSGAEIMYVDATPIFKSLGCELSAVATADELGEFSIYFQNAGFSIYHKPYPKKSKLLKRLIYLFALLRFLKKNKYDVIHLHSFNMILGFSFVAWLAQIDCVYTFHNVFPTNWYSFQYHKTIRWIAKNIFNCKFQTISDSVYNHELNFYKNRTVKIYNWYNDSRFYPATCEEKNQIRNNLRIDLNTLVLISIGGCSDIKRHSDIIKSLAEIKKVIPNVLYIHLGSGASENEEIQLANELKVSENVMFLGNQIDVRRYLAASDIYLMVSKFEGISITTIEAMACKIPAILYDVQGLRDFNLDEKCSVLIKESIESLTNAVLDLQKDIELKALIINNAFSLVNKKFNLKTNVNSIYKLYQ